MPTHLESLWDDGNFTVQTGVTPSRHRLSGTDFGPGIIYYDVSAKLGHHLGGIAQPIASRRQSLPALSFFVNAGPESEIFNPDDRPFDFVRIALKPSAQLAAELPPAFLGTRVRRPPSRTVGRALQGVGP